MRNGLEVGNGPDVSGPLSRFFFFLLSFADSIILAWLLLVFSTDSFPVTEAICCDSASPFSFEEEVWPIDVIGPREWDDFFLAHLR